MTAHALALAAALLAWLMIITASMLRSRGNLGLAMSNRDAMPPASPLAERADRAAKNMLENLVLFAVVLLAVGDHNPPRALLGAEIFVAARVIYWPIYLAGIPVVRTLAYFASLFGLVVLATAML